jgi:aryl-alcohol dehydrogenase-like predicted oxidoreductase
MAQVAIAWSLGRDGISAPIVGTTSIKNLEATVGESIPSINARSEKDLS